MDRLASKVGHGAASGAANATVSDIYKGKAAEKESVTSPPAEINHTKEPMPAPVKLNITTSRQTQ